MKTTIFLKEPERLTSSSDTTKTLPSMMEFVSSSVFGFKTVLLKTLLVGGALMASTSASAEIQISAFEKAKGFHSIMAGDLEGADRALPKYAERHLDYADVNNLCVLQILQKNQADALKSCKKALLKVASSSMKRADRRSAKAGIYANLAAAQIMGGQYTDARYSLDKALSLSKSGALAEANALQNERVLQSRMLAAN